MQSRTPFHLLVPGLLGPMPSLAGSGIEPRIPLLERLLSLGRCEPCNGSDHIATLFHLFGVEKGECSDWPSAPVSMLGDGGSPGDGYWLHADPVMLRPDMERLLLFDARILEITAQEAEALAAEFNSHFAEEGWHLETPVPQRWYLRIPGPPASTFSPLHRVAGRSVRPFLPGGAEANRWHGLLNEIQMLFHHAGVNRAREQAGRPRIGGLWLWGGGVLPDVRGRQWNAVRGGHPLVQGLSRLARSGETEDGAGLWYHEDAFHPVLDGDPQAWVEALQGLEPDLETAVSGLRGGKTGELIIHPCNGFQYRLDGRALRSFWRRRRPIATLLDPPE